jgi:predicted lipoprotein with Yx(FWY)xxD motif
MKRFLPIPILAAGAAAVLAGCGGGYNGNAATNASSSSAATGGSGTKLDLRSTPLGRTIVDGSGRTIYLFEGDHSMTSRCNGACSTIWPPVTTSGHPRIGTGLSTAKLGTTRRADGKTEVTYAGHPLYYYAPDTRPGQVSGEGLDQFGAKWYALSAAGRKIDKD